MDNSSTSLTSVAQKITRVLGILCQELGTKTIYIYVTILHQLNGYLLGVASDTCEIKGLCFSVCHTLPFCYLLNSEAVSSATCQRRFTVDSLIAEKVLSLFLTNVK